MAPKARKDLTLKCPNCSKYITRTNLSRHMKKVCKVIHTCEMCMIRLLSFETLKQHVLEQHNVELFQCKTCRKRFYGNAEYSRHSCRNSSYNCDECNKSFINEKSYKLHLLTHKVVKKQHFCEGCQKNFEAVEDLMSHVRLKHFNMNKENNAIGDKPFKVEWTEKLYNNNNRHVTLVRLNKNLLVIKPSCHREFALIDPLTCILKQDDEFTTHYNKNKKINILLSTEKQKKLNPKFNTTPKKNTKSQDKEKCRDEVEPYDNENNYPTIENSDKTNWMMCIHWLRTNSQCCVQLAKSITVKNHIRVKHLKLTLYKCENCSKKYKKCSKFSRHYCKPNIKL